jgi:hypothetical protein
MIYGYIATVPIFKLNPTWLGDYYIFIPVRALLGTA